MTVVPWCYSGGVDSRGNAVDMEDKAIDVMQSLGKRYDQLDGYYPRPKAYVFLGFHVSDVYVWLLFPVFHGGKLQ